MSLAELQIPNPKQNQNKKDIISYPLKIHYSFYLLTLKIIKLIPINMNRLKFVILVILFGFLVFIIFYKSEISEEDTLTNYAIVEVSYSDVNPNTEKTKFIEEGEYILHLDEFQTVEGRGTGWHISFTRPLEDKDLILIFDAVDTSGNIFTDAFPIRVYKTLDEQHNDKKYNKLYRGYFKIGYMKRISKSYFHYDVIPMHNFDCIIDTAWIADTLGGIEMRYNANHSKLIEEVYGMRLNISGTFHINNAVLSKRILQ